MRLFRNCIVIFLFSILVASCSKEKSSVTTVKVDLLSSREINLQLPYVKTIPIKLENIGFIHQLAVKDSIALFKTDKVLSVNINTGEKFAEYSRKGRANDEYLSAWNVGFEDDMVYIYDMNAKKVMYFTFNGELKYNKTTPLNTQGKPFQQIISYKDNQYIGQRVFGTGDIPELALYDSTFTYMADVSEFILRSSNSFGSRFCRNHKGEVLFNRAFLNDIYEVTDRGATIRYIIDFGEYAVPDLNGFADEMEIIQFINKGQNKGLATMISDIYDSENYLCFSFLLRANGLKAEKALCIYNKKNGEAESYSFESGDRTIQQIIIDNDIVYVFQDNEEGDLFVSKIAVGAL